MKTALWYLTLAGAALASNDRKFSPRGMLSSTEETPESSLGQSREYSWSPTFFATSTFGAFILLYTSAKITEISFRKWSVPFRGLRRDHQRNAIMYAITIIWTTVALALQFPVVMLLKGEYGLFQLHSLRMAGVITCALYIFELVFRWDMRLPLIAHHILTITACALCVTMAEYTQSTSFIVSGFIWLFQATTEQPTFLGLLGYRLKWDGLFCSRLLKIASVQTLLFKCSSAIALLVWWGIHQRGNLGPMNIVWTIFTWTICVGLLFTQFWGSWITWKIGVRIAPKVSSSSVESGASTSFDQSLESPIEEKYNEKRAVVTRDELKLSMAGLPTLSKEGYTVVEVCSAASTPLTGTSAASSAGGPLSPW